MEILETSKNQRVMRHNTNSKHLRYSMCNHTHMWRSHGRVSLAGQILWERKAEKGEELRFQISVLEPPFSSKASVVEMNDYIPW